jgi:hypothetical protein
MGGLFSPHLNNGSKYYLASGYVPPMEISPEQLRELLDGENFPIYRNGWLDWSDDVSVDDF